MDLLKIPGYAEAVQQERVVRDAAFLGVNESIGPFEVVPMTLRHWIVLRLMNSPFLRGGIPAPTDLARLLWLLSPQFHPKGGRVKRRLLSRCRRLFFPPSPKTFFTKQGFRKWDRRRMQKVIEAAKMIEAARKYVDESLQDRPAAQVVNGGAPVFQADYYSDPVYFCALFGREFGWSEEATMAMPLKRLFQYLNEIKDHHNSPVPLCNPSDRVKSAWMRQVNERGKKSDN